MKCIRIIFSPWLKITGLRRFVSMLCTILGLCASMTTIAVADRTPIFTRIDFFTSESEFLNGKPDVSYSSYSANFNAGQNFSFPIGGVPSKMTITGTEKETVTDDTISSNVHTGISINSVGKTNSISAGLNEVKTKNRQYGKSLGETQTENFYMNVAVTDPGLPPVNLSLNEATNAGSENTSISFKTSYSMPHTNFNFSQFANESQSIGRPKSENERYIFNISDSRTPGRNMRWANSIALERQESKSESAALSDGDTKRFTSNISYTGMERTSIRGNFSIFDEKLTSGITTKSNKYFTYMISDTLRLSDESSLVFSHSGTNNRTPDVTKNSRETQNISYSRNFGRRMNLSMTHNTQKTRNIVPASASSKSESFSMNINANISPVMSLSANIVESSGNQTLNIRMQSSPVRGLPVSYSFSDSGNSETHDISTSFLIMPMAQSSLKYTQRTTGEISARSFSYSLSGRLRNDVRYNMSFSDSVGTKDGKRTSTSLTLSMTVTQSISLDLSVVSSDSRISRTTTTSIGITSRL